MFEINVSAEKGYAWAFPSKGNLLNIGIGVPLSIFKKEKLDINELLQDFIAQLEKRGVVVENVRDEKSYLLPFASSRPKIKQKNVFAFKNLEDSVEFAFKEALLEKKKINFLLSPCVFIISAC